MGAVLITGAGSGLGRALALGMAERGYSIILVSKGRKNLEETARLAEKSGVPVFSYVLDVSSLAEVKKLKAALAKKKIKIDILINNAGFGFFNTVESTPLNLVEKMLAVNYLGSVYFSKVFLSDLKKRNGIIVFINTVGGKVLIPKFGAYSASKAALDFYGRALAKEVKGKITVINVYPGPMKTSFWKEKSLRQMRVRLFFSLPNGLPGR